MFHPSDQSRPGIINASRGYRRSRQGSLHHGHSIHLGGEKLVIVLVWFGLLLLWTLDRTSDDQSSCKRIAALGDSGIERIALLGLSFCCGKVATTGAFRIKDLANAQSVLKDRATVSAFLAGSV
jgi:hypothetical protein